VQSCKPDISAQSVLGVPEFDPIRQAREDFGSTIRILRTMAEANWGRYLNAVAAELELEERHSDLAEVPELSGESTDNHRRYLARMRDIHWDILRTLDRRVFPDVRHVPGLSLPVLKSLPGSLPMVLFR